MQYPRSFTQRYLRAIGALPVAATLCVAPLTAQTPECPGYDPDEGIVWGFVTAQEGGAAVPGADIVVSWDGGETRAQSIQNGVYIVCGVRPDVPLRIEAGFAPLDGDGVPAVLGVGEILRLPLTVAFGGRNPVAVTGRVVGRVVDRLSLEPIPNAMIGADGQYTGITNDAGRFRLDDVLAGPQTLAVRHLAYGETQSVFDMPVDGTLELEIRLDQTVLAVEPIEVEIIGVRSHKLENAGFYERKMWSDRLGLGSYLTRAEIERRGAAQASHVIAEIPRVTFQRGRCFNSRCAYPIISGGSANCGTMKQDGMEYLIGASIYLDGVRQRMATGGVATGIDDLIKPADIAGVEVYTGSGDLPGEFADYNAQRCGAVVIWTGR